LAAQRSERIRCHLPCEIMRGRRRRIPATVTGLSEKGFNLEMKLGVDQGDALRICLLPHRGKRAVTVDAIAWSTRERYDLRTGQSRRETGFMVSDPGPAFLELVEEVRRRENSVSPIDVRNAKACDGTLPRPRSPLPLHKPDEEENLPRFRVRLKHGGSPRSRSATVRARSAQEAERRALGDLDSEWAVLSVTPLRD
jgi:hypothetical protein